MHRTITPADCLPVQISEIKQHLRIDFDEDDALLAGYAAAAASHAETILNRPLLNTIMETTLPCFPFRPVELRGRVQSIESVKYLDLSGVEQTVAPAVYRLNTAAEPGRLYLSVNQYWPASLAAEDAVRVRYVSGYGDQPSDVPESIRQAILLLCGLWYEQRLPVVIGASVGTLPFGIECLLAPHKLWGFA